ncbi:MAG: hypothetical protein ACPL3C_00445 [Pyrobaculum sp.]|uniref:hypothetical protein n=1 Tax=Pyrobaculum sp. TaxID=2004705 RepID=UPI003CA5B646
MIKTGEIAPRRAPAALKNSTRRTSPTTKQATTIWKLKKREAIDDTAPYAEFFSKLLAHMAVYSVGLRDEVIDIAIRRGLL